MPTFAEAGLKDFGLINFTGLWAPKGTPAAVVERLQKEIATAMASADMKAFAEGIASEPGYWDAATFAKDLSEEKTITVRGVSLDDLFARESIGAVDLMKVDIQGAERLLIQGGQHALRTVSVLSMEVLFEPLYQGCSLFGELHELLRALGFHLHGFHGWRRGPQGFLLYADAVFVRV